MKRVVTGIVTAALATAIVLYLPPRFFVAVATGVVLLAAAEYTALVQRIAVAPRFRLALWLTLVFVALASSVPQIAPLSRLVVLDVRFAAATVVLAMAVAVGLSSRAEMRDRLTISAMFAFGALWLGLFLVAAVHLHQLHSALLLWVLAVAAVGDIGAYYGGRAFGRRPLAPEISPKKTIAGAVSGLAASLGVGLAGFLPWFALDQFVLSVPLAALACGAAGQAGDLVASLLKRAAKAKDASRLLPGHGGLLDRLDSVMLATPLMYVLVDIGTFGPAVSVLYGTGTGGALP
jgi:phosphatidate cytidylyltransferase